MKSNQQTNNKRSDCSITVAAESGGDFYKNYPFNVAGGGRSKASNSAASSQASLSGSCPASVQGVTSTSTTAASAAAAAAAAAATVATASTLNDEHVSRANSRRMVGRSLITDTATPNPINPKEAQP